VFEHIALSDLTPSLQAEEIFEGLVALVDSKSLPASRGKVKIVPAQLSVDAGVMGAAILAKMSEKN
jgi:hypothetical protein